MKKQTTRFVTTALLILFAAKNLLAITYFVSNSGNDTNSGTSIDAPWATVTKVSGENFKPGDSILFERNGIWREEALTVSSSGTENDYILYGAYGEGEKPRLLGSRQLTVWENHSGNIWRAACDFNPYPANYDISELFIVTADSQVLWTSHVENTGAISNDLEWTWEADSIYLQTPEDPNTYYHSIEAPNVLNMIRLEEQQYIHIENLEIAYVRRTGIYDRYGSSQLAGLKIYNNYIHHIHVKDGPVGYGLNLKHSDVHIAYNDIHDCGRRNISLVTYNTQPAMHIQNIVVENNYLHSGWHTTGVDLNTTGSHHVENVTIRNNYFHDPAGPDLEQNPTWGSNMIFLANQGSDNALIEKIYIHNNIFHTIRGFGVLVEGVSNVHVHHNTFYGFDPTRTSFTAFVSLGHADSTSVKNNIFYDNGQSAHNRDIYCVNYSDAASYAACEMDYNLYYEEDAASRTIMLQALGQGGFPNNYYTYTLADWEAYKRELERDLNSPDPSDPLFIDAPNDFNLQDGSGAFSAGAPLGFETDYYGNPRSLLKPTIGAIEMVNPDTTLAFIEHWSFKEQFEPASIDTAAKTVDVQVVNGTNRSNLVPTIYLNIGSTVNPTSGVANDFTQPVSYTVTAPDGITENTYTVIVSEAINQAPEISGVHILGNAYIDSTITVIYDYYDLEDDAEGQTLFNWYSGGTSTGITAQNYTVQPGDSSQQLYCVVTPVALSGTSPGSVVYSDTTNAVLPYHVRVENIEIGQYDDRTIVIQFDSILHADYVPDIADFEVTENGNNFGIQHVGIINGKLYVTMDSIGHFGMVYQLTYNRGETIMQSHSGVPVLSLSDLAIKNNMASTIYENLLLYSEELDNDLAWNDAGQLTRITADQHIDMKGNQTLEYLQHGENGNQMILIHQGGITNHIVGNTTYTLEFDVYSDNPRGGEDGWEIHIVENNGTNHLYHTYGDSIVAGQVTRIAHTFTTQANTNQLAVRPNDKWSPNWDGYWGRMHLYRGEKGARLYIRTLGEQIVDSLKSNTPEPSKSVDILGFSIPTQLGGSVINNNEHSVSLTMPYGTNLASLTPDIDISPGANISPASQTTQDFTNPFTYTITAEDGIAQQAWTVTISVKDEIINIDNTLRNSISKIYPNPIDNLLNIETLAGSTICITGISGSMVYKKVLKDNRVEIFTGDWPSGIYPLQIIDNDGAVIYYGKMVKF
jgi:hypothetical protein